MQCLVHFNSFFLCEVGHLGLPLLFSLSVTPQPPHPREPGVVLLCFEEHRPRCPNVHGGGMIIGATRTHGQRGTCLGMIFRRQVTEATSLVWKISPYCTYERWTKWKSSFWSGKCYWAFIILCTLHHGKSKFMEEFIYKKNLDRWGHGNKRPWFKPDCPFWGKARTSTCFSFLPSNPPAAGLLWCGLLSGWSCSALSQELHQSWAQRPYVPSF